MVSAFYNGDQSRADAPLSPAIPARPEPRTVAQQDELIAAVRRWWDAGCFVHPATTDGSKKPAGVSGGSNQKNERGAYRWGFARVRDGELPRFSLEQLEQMIRAGRMDGIGIFCGWQSGGIEMVEVEGRAADLLDKVKQAAVEKGCLHLLERLGSGCAERTAGGGIHFVLRVVGGPNLPDQVLARRPQPADETGKQPKPLTLAETSGQSQWFVAAPSAGRTHKSGRAYQFVRGGPETIPNFTPEERDQVYDCFRAIDEMPQQVSETVAQPRRPRRQGEPLTPGQDFNVRGWDWKKILTGCSPAWKANGEATKQQADDGTTVEHQSWTRPGKSDGTSATTIGGTLRCWSSSTSLPQYQQPSGGEKTGKNALSKFAVYAHLYHKPSGNPDEQPDWKAATRALAELGFGSDGLEESEVVVVEPVPDRGPARDLDDWRVEMGVSRSLSMRVPGLHLDRSPTGSGKTTATTRAIKSAIRTTVQEAADDDSVVPIRRTLTLLPDHANIVERVREMRAEGLDAVAYPPRDETTCGNLEAVRRAEGLGLIAGAAVCPTCTLRKTCLYNQQRKAAEQADHTVATHERFRLSPVSTAKDRQVLVIDETPEQVLAPSITIRVDDLGSVLGLLTTVRDELLFRHGHVMEPEPEEREAAAALIAAYERIVEAAGRATEPGVVEVEMPPPLQPAPRPARPKQPRKGGKKLMKRAKVARPNLQRTLLRWAVETGIGPGRDRRQREKFGKALRLLTMIATGRIERLHLMIDQTSRHERQADGTVREWNPMHHHVVGSWKTRLPSVPVICLDATADADGLRAATGREVLDCTPEGHLPNVSTVVQVPWDVTAGQSPRTAAGFVEAFLTAHPEIQRLGLIGHQDHIRAMMEDDQILPPRLRQRVAKACWYGAGPDRASNDWHDACDALLLVGTLRPGGGAVRERLVIRGQFDAARRDGDWGVRHWDAVTTDGRTIRVEGKGYRDPEWHSAHVSISRAAVHQAAGRGRAITDKGIPVWIISDEPTGAPVDDSLEPVSPVVREVVEAVRAIRDGGQGTELFPIRDSYRRKFGSQVAVKVEAVIDLLRAMAGKLGKKLGQRAIEKRLLLAVTHGRLQRAARGWLIVTGDDAAVASADLPVALTAISAAGPAASDPPLEVAAVAVPEGVTAVCTSTAAAPPELDPLLEELEERAAILEADAGHDRETADLLAREMVLGRGVIEPVAPAEPVGVDHATLAARLDPLVDAAVARLGGTVRLLRPEDDPFQGRRPIRPSPDGRKPVCRCGSYEVVEERHHGGQSLRHCCAGCDRFIRQVVWYGKPIGQDDAGPPSSSGGGTAQRDPPKPERLCFVPVPVSMPNVEPMLRPTGC